MRKILLDADLPKRLQTELTYRGRAAESISQHHLSRSKDPVLLEHVRRVFDLSKIILVTGDDQMLLEHREHAVGITIAVVDPQRPQDLFFLDPWRRECVHRWAHLMVEQDTGTWFRYGLRRSVWKRPRTIRRQQLTLPIDDPLLPPG